ncbi:MAG TPA: hypothetical protein PKH07_06900 [bacterium]|nr:hypothetical protein [bacterium]
MRLALTVTLVLALAPIVQAGTWIDNFEDGALWTEWQVFEGAEKVDAPSIEEADGRATLSVQPGQTLTLSAGQFEGDFFFTLRSGLPSITAKGKIGLFLGKAPLTPGTPAVHASLVHSPDSPEFRAGVVGETESNKPYMAISSFAVVLSRAGEQVTVFIGEDDTEPLDQLGQAFALPAGPVDAFIALSADADAEPWKIQIDEVKITGDSVPDKAPATVAAATEATGEGKPFDPNEASRHANSGFKMLQRGQFEEALNEYAIAAQLSKRYVEIHNTLRDHIVPALRSPGGREAIRDVPIGPKGTTIGEWLQW